MAKVILNCDGIVCDHTFEVELPEWYGRNEPIDMSENGSWLFHPDCKLQGEWFDAVCPGCVESFPDCRLSNAFQYSDSPGLTQAHKDTIRAGRCPFRTNGTSEISRAGVTPIDLSSIASPESGDAIVKAIDEYWFKYHTGK